MPVTAIRDAEVTLRYAGVTIGDQKAASDG
jgi:hypothetical protein